MATAQKAPKSPVVTTEDITTEAPAEVTEYTRVTSPQGFESTVPRSILDSLLDAGYVVVK